MLKRAIFIFLSFLLLSSCKKENFLRLTSSENIQAFIPNYSSPKRFASNMDTIELSLRDSIQYFSKANTDLSVGGTLPDFDKLELQQTFIVIGCDTPYLRFHFDLQTLYNNSLPTRAEDRLFITFEDISGKTDAEIELNYKDSLTCLSERGSFQDTLYLLSRDFREVYFTRRDTVSRSFLYLNNTNGLIGFKTSDQKLYELIP